SQKLTVLKYSFIRIYIQRYSLSYRTCSIGKCDVLRIKSVAGNFSSKRCERRNTSTPTIIIKSNDGTVYILANKDYICIIRRQYNFLHIHTVFNVQRNGSKWITSHGINSILNIFKIAASVFSNSKSVFVLTRIGCLCMHS